MHHPQSPLTLPRLSLGCVTFGREIDQPTSFSILDHATDNGLTLLDTAEAYGGGQSHAARQKNNPHDPHVGADRSAAPRPSLEATTEPHSSELILGRWLATHSSRRAKIFLQTKVTPPLTPDRILASLDASLRRLQTDYLDAFLLHAPDPNTPITESLSALATALQRGKTRHVGVSNFSAAQLEQALTLASTNNLPRLELAQFNYNLAVRDAESTLLPLCAQEKIPTQTYSPLGAGFLTGKYNPDTRSFPPGSRFDLVPGHANVYFHPEKFQIAGRLQALSTRTQIPLPQLAIAWVLSNPHVNTVLIGARTPTHINTALAATHLQWNPAWTPELLAPAQ